MIIVEIVFWIKHLIETLFTCPELGRFAMIESMIEIYRYRNENQTKWNEFVSDSKTQSFLFYREFIEYHKDRFEDHSLIALYSGKIIALLPASQSKDQLTSHGGLTYGGWITGNKMTAEMMLKIFDELVVYMRDQGFNRLVYRALPHIYHRLPAEEDLYALFRVGAKLDKRTVSTTIDYANPLKLQERRRRGVSRARKQGVEIKDLLRCDEFWPLLSQNLQKKHGVEPVHSLQEIHLLKDLFPDDIRIVGAFTGAQLVAGVVVFVTETVAHLQYISANEQGKDCGALDFLISSVIDDYKEKKRFFDFGISTEQGGEVLNVGLAAQKEGFGGRSTVYDSYSLEL